MATTLKIANGDAVFNTSTGRPKLLGNAVDADEDVAQSRLKASQDLRRSLSINRIITGDGAAIQELIGKTSEIGISSIELLLNKRIRDMFSAILRLQRVRSNIRKPGESFTHISFLSIFKDKTSVTSYRFRLDVRTATNDQDVIRLSGAVG